MTHPPLVEVTWLDAVTYTETFTLKDIPEKCPLAKRTTSGYLVAQTEDGRTLIAHTSDPDATEPAESEGSDVTVIPTGWVQSIRYRTRKPRKRKEK